MSRLRLLAFGLFAPLCLVAAACTPGGTGTTPTNQLPTAVATATPSTGNAPLPVTFSSVGSVDPDGTITGYTWNFGDGSAISTLAGPTHSYGLSGNYVATLTVTDNSGGNGTASMTVVVNPPVNQSPVAVVAATPTSGIAPLPVSFSSAGSTDPDGSIAAYDWDFGDGSPHSSAPSPTHTYTTAGSHSTSLTVTDDHGATNTATVVVAVAANDLPTAVANGTPTTGKEPLNVVFSSGGSTDTDGSIVGYSWSFGDGSALSAAANPSHTYTGFGNYTATLTVTDDKGGIGTNTVSLTVNANQPPHAVANGSPTGGIVPVTVGFNGSASTDPDGTIVSYLWNFGDTNSSIFPNPSHTYGSVGTYTATLTVTDDNGVSNTDAITISVNGVPNVPPTAVAGSTPTSGKVPLTVALSSAGSIDSDGTITGYAWDFGDGSGSNQASPSHLYLAPGTYVATLNVTDNNGGVGTATTTIVVNPNQAPTAGASGTPTSGKEPLTVAFSSAGSSDPDGTLVSRSWDFGDGSTSSTANPSHVYSVHGAYTAVLTVTDDNGATATASVPVVVNANIAPTAVLNATPVSGARPLVVSFDSSSSVDPDGTLVSRSLNFGDGSGTTTASVTTHTYGVGTWTATQTVTDDNGVARTANKTITVVIDDDADGYSPPADCNDTNAAVNPGATDALDATALDSNCDGVDGVLANTYFVKAGGGSDTGTCGALATPCQTIAQGITRAKAAGKTVVQIAGGTYGGFALQGGLTLRGGYGQTFTSRSAGDTTTVNGSNDGSNSCSAMLSTAVVSTSTFDLTVQGAAGSGACPSTFGLNIGSASTSLTFDTVKVTGGTNAGATAVLIQGGSNVVLQRMTINSGSTSGAGSSAYGVRALSSVVVIGNSAVIAQAGIGGTGGSSSAGTAGSGANGGGGGGGCDHCGSSGGSGGSTAGSGGSGGSNPGRSAGNGGATGNGGACGGSGGGTGYYGGSKGTGGCGGGSGSAGSGGSAGPASNGAYGTTFANIANNGGTGGTGANGQGGGGGGAGGAGCDGFACVGDWLSGGAGGGAGGGGFGGVGGGGGQGGGGSFGVYSSSSSVSIDANTTVTASAGGSGGSGGAPQTGGTGGSGGGGGNGNCTGGCANGGGGGGGNGSGGSAGNSGTSGNNGGDGAGCCNGTGGGGGGGAGGGGGGTGGTGGGGAGGPSIGLTSKGTGGVTFAGNTTTQIVIAGAASGGTGGNSGSAGTAAKTVTVP